MAVSRATEKAIQVFFQQLAIDKTFAAARDRHAIPANGDRQREQYAGMKCEFLDQIPTFFNHQENRDDQSREQDAERPLRLSAQADQYVEDDIPKRMRQTV